MNVMRMIIVDTLWTQVPANRFQCVLGESAALILSLYTFITTDSLPVMLHPSQRIRYEYAEEVNSCKRHYAAFAFCTAYKELERS